MRPFDQAGEVAKVGPVPMQIVNQWCADGTAPHAQPGSGQGRHRLFTPVQVVALIYGFFWRTAGEADMRWVARVIEFVAGQSEEHLLAEFAEGRTFVLPFINATGLVDPKDIEKALGRPLPPVLDLEQTYRQVRERLERLDRPSGKQKARRPGRKKAK
jgi:hypothetical protein